MHTSKLALPNTLAPSAIPGDRTTKNMIYLYLLLLLFEGALRKWVFPGLANPLTIVRDPIAILIIGNFLLTGRKLLNPYTLTIVFTGLLAFLFSLAAGHGNFLVAVYGLRTLSLHFVLIFVIGKILTRQDVENIGRWMLVLAIPATILIGLQFYSPQSAWVNRGIGGDMAGSGFGGAMGYFRPSGFFSFTNGNTFFFGLVVAFLAYFWTERKKCPMWLLLAATICAMIVVPLSISRGYLIRIIITGGFLFAANLISSRSIFPLLLPLLFLPIIYGALIQFDFMQTALEVLSVRFEQAAVSEGGTGSSVKTRVFGAMINALSGSTDGSVPLLGYGLGMGTNLGAVLMGGEKTFQLGESEWGRILNEMGPILGIIVLLVRALLTWHLFRYSLKQLRQGNKLPFLLASFGLSIVLFGGWAQPTSLGFFVVGASFIIAASNSLSRREAFRQF